MASENRHELDKNENSTPGGVLCLAGGFAWREHYLPRWLLLQNKARIFITVVLTRFRPAKVCQKRVKPLFQLTVLNTQQGIQLKLPLLLLTQLAHNLENQAVWLECAPLNSSLQLSCNVPTLLTTTCVGCYQILELDYRQLFNHRNRF